MRKLPSTLYVSCDEPPNSELCLLSEQDFAGFAMVNQEVPVGVYKLTATKRVTSKAELKYGTRRRAMTDQDRQARAERLAKQLMCDENQIIWEQHKHCPEEVRTILAHDRETERAVWEEVIEKVSALADEHFKDGNTQRRRALEVVETWCRQRAEE